MDDDAGVGNENSRVAAPNKSSSPSKPISQNKSSPIRREDYKSEGIVTIFYSLTPSLTLHSINKSVSQAKSAPKTSFAAAGAKDELLRQSTESDNSATLSVATTATDKSDEDLRALRRKRKSTG